MSGLIKRGGEHVAEAMWEHFHTKIAEVRNADPADFTLGQTREEAAISLESTRPLFEKWVEAAKKPFLVPVSMASWEAQLAGMLPPSVPIWASGFDALKYHPFDDEDEAVWCLLKYGGR